MKETLIFIVGGLIIFGIIWMSISSHESEIKSWAKNNNLNVVNIQTHVTAIGTPFYYVNKGSFIFEVDVITKSGKPEKWWIRTGVFSNDYEKAK
jgi:glucan phosphoethanolaminetransferase (alkaline phosphatase superfamily)